MSRLTTLLLLSAALLFSVSACDLLGGDRTEKGVDVISHPNADQVLETYAESIDEARTSVSNDTVTITRWRKHGLIPEDRDSVKVRLRLVTTDGELPTFVSYWDEVLGGLYGGEIQIAEWNPGELVLGEVKGHHGDVARSDAHVYFWSDFDGSHGGDRSE